MTGDLINCRSGTRFRWLALLIAATSLSGCMASALDTSAIHIPQSGQGFAFADEGSVSVPRPAEELVTGSTSDVAATTGPVAISEDNDTTLTALAGSEPTSSSSGAFPPPSGSSSDTLASSLSATSSETAPESSEPGILDPATARIYSSVGQQAPPTPRPPVSGLAKRTGSLLALFSNNRSDGARTALIPATPDGKQAELWSSPSSRDSNGKRPVIASARASVLPGVDRERALGLKASDAEDDKSASLPIRLASAAGLARLAPNGLNVQHDKVDVSCLKPALVRVITKVERHYGRDVVVTSGYRSPSRNKQARGSSNSLHMYCSAADIQVKGVTKWQLAEYLRAMPGRGGVGTYCHTQSVHIDIGPQRDWNWRCRRKK